MFSKVLNREAILERDSEQGYVIGKRRKQFFPFFLGHGQTENSILMRIGAVGANQIGTGRLIGILIL